MSTKIPENCPVKDILKQVAQILTLLEKVLEHCERCIRKEGD